MKIYYAVNPDGTEVCANDTYFGLGLFRHHKTVDELVQKFGNGYKHCYDKPDCWCNCFSEGYYTVPKFNGVILPKGTIKTLTGKELTWEDEPLCINL